MELTHQLEKLLEHWYTGLSPNRFVTNASLLILWPLVMLMVINQALMTGPGLPVESVQSASQFVNAMTILHAALAVNLDGVVQYVLGRVSDRVGLGGH